MGGTGDCLDDAIPYEKLQPGENSLPIMTEQRSSLAHLGILPLMQLNTSEPRLSESPARSNLHDDVRRHSGRAPSSSTARDSHTTAATDLDSVASLKNPPSSLKAERHGKTTLSPLLRIRKWSGQKVSPSRDPRTSTVAVGPFLGITTTVPKSSFDNLASPDQVQFSNRGSMLIGGKRANQRSPVVNHHARPSVGRRQLANSNSTPPTFITPVKELSVDDEVDSRKVRSMYEVGMEHGTSVNYLTPIGSGATERDMKSQDTPDLHHHDVDLSIPDILANYSNTSHTNLDSGRSSSTKREDHELAGGIEDWEDVNGEDIDRYGFIVPRRVASATMSVITPCLPPPESRSLQRVSSSLQLASKAPRRQHSKLGRSPSVNWSVHSTTSRLSDRRLSQRRTSSSGGSYQSSLSRPVSRIRSAANLLPHNRERRCVDEAGDMLTLPPGLADIAENEEGRKVENEAKRREWEREDKWRNMAKLVRPNRDGGGMAFEFDTRSPKLVSRTWKGIPDRWRATAWHAFLTASAKKRPESLSDQEVIKIFHELIERSSADDVQIDLDVPRTINCHIMFRRRYRGGQRLLFRVLHCMSVFFPETGYVQGMAALAATMLCYYDEEMAFVMLVRMWQLRGIARLYQSGFEGLMEALDEFEKKWLVGSEVAKKLVKLDPLPWPRLADMIV